MDKYETNDAVNFALEGKPIEFETAVNQLLAQRMHDAVDNKREEVAQSVFPSASDTADETEE